VLLPAAAVQKETTPMGTTQLHYIVASCFENTSDVIYCLIPIQWNCRGQFDIVYR
jgi:hypothetical protein